MPNIKIDNIEVSEESLRKVIKEHPELLEVKKERPLGDDFSMLGYIKNIDLNYRTARFHLRNSTLTRINALLKIWEWKEKNDRQFGYKEVFDENTTKWSVYYFCWSKKLDITYINFIISHAELPYFSSEEIAEKALKELEAEYQIVFNVA